MTVRLLLVVDLLFVAFYCSACSSIPHDKHDELDYGKFYDDHMQINLRIIESKQHNAQASLEAMAAELDDLILAMSYKFAIPYDESSEISSLWQEINERMERINLNLELVHERIERCNKIRAELEEMQKDSKKTPDKPTD